MTSVQLRVVALVSSFLVIAAGCGTPTTAHAQASAPAPPRVDVFVQGTAGVFLEERLPDRTSTDPEAGWRYVCTIPCRAPVTSAPYAEHRLVEGARFVRVDIRGKEGAIRVVRYAGESPAATPLILGGVVVAGAGLGFVLIGALKGLSNALGHVDVYGCGGDRNCEEAKAAPKTESAADAENKAQAQRSVGIGFALMVAGALVLAAGGVKATPSVEVLSPDGARRARVQPRTPTWTVADLPRPPNHTALLELHF